jgi:serine/threonine protein kinase
MELRLTRLEHPAIVPCHAVEVAGGRPYAVLELSDAESLDRLFPERGRARFSLEAATNLLLGVMDALAAAANEKIVHGRLAPNDVLVHADGSVAVTGFGQSGDLRMDFLAVHRLAQRLNAPWPPEIDAWLDTLVSERGSWKDARAARAAFPLAFADAGRKALDRSVKSRRRRDQKALEAASLVAEEEVEGAEEAPEPAARKDRPTLPREEAEATLKQARLVALSALAIVLVALAIEVLGLAG